MKPVLGVITKRNNGKRDVKIVWLLPVVIPGNREWNLKVAGQ